MPDEPEEQSKGRAEEQTGDDGEIEGGMFALVDNVTGKAAEAQGEFTAEVEKRAYDDEEPAENKKGAAKLADRIHRPNFNRS